MKWVVQELGPTGWETIPGRYGRETGALDAVRDLQKKGSGAYRHVTEEEASRPQKRVVSPSPASPPRGR